MSDEVRRAACCRWCEAWFMEDETKGLCDNRELDTLATQTCDLFRDEISMFETAENGPVTLRAVDEQH